MPSSALASVRLLAAKEAAEDALRISNARLETLLREVNHRVSNSLAMVSAFVHMQPRRCPTTSARRVG